ncbi:unnamed protein product [Taenia asiatica]|uniref:Septin-type G domain-containing protein n=1 Tax=Taenia asiatica TaxID=60517 RepID=A0A158R830_TAEAS|nr:unnamed protein product [Taenia asiatica]
MSSLGMVRCRVYPWGTVETDSLEHNDFQALKTLLMRHFMQDLIDVTYTTHYANYRTSRLTDIMEAAHFNLQDGREPLSQLDAERRAHQVKLDKLVEEMNQVYVEKVREREKRLKDSEREMAERVRQLQQQLEAEAENLASARQAFNDERVAWEMENRDYADPDFLFNTVNATCTWSAGLLASSWRKLRSCSRSRKLHWTKQRSQRASSAPGRDSASTSPGAISTTMIGGGHRATLHCETFLSAPLAQMEE